ncbi:MAG: hypothetical protein AAF481_10410 [Acidobacteriota bacterium]
MLLVGLLAIPSAAGAQDRNLFTVTALGALGGSLDADRGDGVENTGFQLGFSMVTEPRTHVGVRVGQLHFDDPLESFFDADLSYLTLAGEYRYDEGVYDSGIYLGIGGYQLEGSSFAGRGLDETAFGAVLGFTGEFPITQRFGFALELSGHFVDFDETQLFAIGHAGISYRF